MANAAKRTDLATVEPSAGGSVKAIVPQNYDEVKALAIDLAMAGDVIPKAFRGKPPEVLGAVILRGSEVGFKPMQALSAIAMINGVASIYGDALSALMFQHGHHIDWRYEGEGDLLVCIATLERGDTGRKIEREFSMYDAKRARLLTKEGPWTQYPKRMLSMRARAWACRDGAPDVLMGLSVVEEVQDYESARDVTPREAQAETPMQRKVREQRERDAARASVPAADVILSQEAVREAQASTRPDGDTFTLEGEVKDPEASDRHIDEAQARHDAEKAKPEVEDAEVVEDTDPEPEEEAQEQQNRPADDGDPEEEEYDPTAASYAAGTKAYQEGKPIEKVPAYGKEANKASWRMGWRHAKKAAE